MDRLADDIQLGRRLTGWYVLFVVVFCLWYNAMYNLMAGGSLFPYTSMEMMCLKLTLSSLPFILLFVLNTFWVFRWNPVRRNVALKIVTDLAGSAGIVVLVNFLFYGVSLLMGKRGTIFWSAAFTVDILVWLVNEVGYFVVSFRVSESRADKARRLASQLQYDVLKAQVDPHFLFNSLNILYSLSEIDVEKSREFILSLSRMYRYIMIQHERQRVVLKDELELIRFYTDILKMRYWEQIEVEIDISPEVDPASVEIVPFSIQMLLENVTKHNVICADTPMHVRVAITRDGVAVTNPVYPKKAVGGSSGIGLRYLRKMYGYYGKEFTFGESGGEFTVMVPFLDKDKNEVNA